MKGRLCALAALLAAIISVSGCGSGDSASPVSAADQYQQKVYVIGEIKPPETSATTQISEVKGVTDETKQVFVNRVAYDGTATDAPIFIAADSIATLSDTMKRGLLNTYLNKYPIILISGKEADINALLGAVGLPQNYRLPKGMEYVEIFAIDQEPGHTFFWEMYPPDLRPVQFSGGGEVYLMPTFSDSQEARQQRLGMLRNWMLQDGSRVTSATLASKTAAVNALSNVLKQSDTAGAQLSDIHGYHKDMILFSSTWDDPASPYTYGNNYTFNYSMYSVHTFDSTDGKEYDWFYVSQAGTFNPVGTYTGIKPVSGGFGSGTFFNPNYDRVQGYASYYDFNYYMTGSSAADSGVTLIQSSPENKNNVTKVKSEINFTLNLKVGFEGTKPALNLAPSLSITDSKEFEVQDVEVMNKSGTGGHNASWRYQFKKPDESIQAFSWYCRLSEPPNLSRNAFTPVNKWIWKFDSTLRANNRDSFHAYFTPSLGDSLSGKADIISSACHGRADGESGESNWYEFDMPLFYPPLLVVTQNVDFSSAGQYKAFDIGVSRDWTATSSAPSWCRVDPASGTGKNPHVTVTVDQNTTKSGRTATITFTTKDGKGKDTMTVYQSQYQ